LNWAGKTVTAVGGGCYFGVVAAAPATSIALVFVAAKDYQVALAAGTIARYAAGATLGRPARRGRGGCLCWKRLLTAAFLTAAAAWGGEADG
jgi:hypothetical protein